MKRQKLTVAYDGTNYCGWQIQPNGITVEEVLNRALRKLTGKRLRSSGQAEQIPGTCPWECGSVDSETHSAGADFICPERGFPDDIVVIRSKKCQQTGIRDTAIQKRMNIIF